MLQILARAMKLIWSLRLVCLRRNSSLFLKHCIQLFRCARKVILRLDSLVCFRWSFSPILLSKCCEKLTLSLWNWLLISLMAWGLKLIGIFDCAREKIRFDDDFGLASALSWRHETWILTRVFFAKLATYWIEGVTNHRILHLTH